MNAKNQVYPTRFNNTQDESVELFPVEQNLGLI